MPESENILTYIHNTCIHTYKDVGSQLLFLCRPCLPATMFPAEMVMDTNPLKSCKFKIDDFLYTLPRS